jgi:hypothetical protein
MQKKPDAMIASGFFVCLATRAYLRFSMST